MLQAREKTSNNSKFNLLNEQQITITIITQRDPSLKNEKKFKLDHLNAATVLTQSKENSTNNKHVIKQEEEEEEEHNLL